MGFIYSATASAVKRSADDPDNILVGRSRSSFVVSISLAMVATTTVSFCFARRLGGINVRSLSSVPLARWLILAVFLDSWMFVLSSTILQASFGLNSDPNACDAGILLCLVCYLSSKVLIYFFLVEKVFIVRGSRCSRFKDPLFLFNTLGMLVPYCVVIILTFVFRNAEIGPDGQCRIGLKPAGNIPLLIFDASINIYLTFLFLKPLAGLWSFQHGDKSKRRLRTVAFRTFIGSCATLISTLGNLISLLVLKGKEPGWICFAICNSDILFSVLVLHWVTHQDDIGQSEPERCDHCKHTLGARDQYSLSRGSVFRELSKGGAGGGKPRAEVITSIHAGKRDEHSKSIPLDSIMTHTEVRRDVESLGGTSESFAEEQHEERVNSTDNIRQSPV